MLLNCNVNYNPNFGAIRLSAKHAEMTDNALQKLASFNITPKEQSIVKNNLFNLLNPYLRNEARYRTSDFRIYEEVLSELYLKFSELLYDVKNNSDVNIFINNLNEHKLSANTYKNQKGLSSLDEPEYTDSDKIKKVDLLTYKDLPTPTKATILQKLRNKLDDLIKNGKISPNLKKILIAKADGLKHREIAVMQDISIVTIKKAVKKGITELQYQNNMLPNSAKEKIKKLSNILNCSEKEAAELILKNICLIYTDLNFIDENIKVLSKNLGCSKQEFIKAGFKQPSLLYTKSETLMKHVRESSKNIELTEKEYIKTGLKEPELFVLKPETIMHNIKSNCISLDCSKQAFIKAGQQSPCIFLLKPQTILNNVQNSASAIGCDIKEFIKVALKKPPLFYMKTETILNNIKQSAKNFACTEKELVKLALKLPNLFCQKPETLLKNVEQNSNNFNCSIHEFIKAGFKQPQLFVQKPETLLNHTIESARILKCPIELYIKAALEQPPLFYMNGTTLVQNVTKSAKICNMSVSEFVQLALTKPTLFYIKPETIEKKIKLTNFYNKVQNKTKKSKMRMRADKEFYDRIWGTLIKNAEPDKKTKSIINVKRFCPNEFLKINSDKTFTLDIPADEVTDEIIKYIQETSVNSIGKNIFEFNIINDEIQN